ncbi:TrbI/VirB10 family protein [Terricaulis silvestris]|uniref:Type IV secretion system protein virB10 n=1 Tax=Terricaulis silvestris TaxID=2686094 RepID=A0A6I6MTN7_9CAUL|nr:TrbI/VirB10 family protein [Terricaulis silvestris]QGZ96826.1 Type IV secretion system protein virB10 [Terricaulis silvestris]
MTAADDLEPLRRDNLSAFQAAPSVGVASSPWAVGFGIFGAAVLGLLIFAALNGSRLQSAKIEPSPPESGVVQRPTYVAPPAYDAELEPELAFEEDLAVEAMPIETPASDPLSPDARLHSPALIIDLSQSEGALGGPNAQAIAGAVAGDALSGNERFAARYGAGQAAHARPLANPNMTIPQGVIIAGVLETAINSDLPGYARALVSRDVRAFDGGAVLVPRGSRLIGQYRASSELGQSRAFVIWTRLIRPDGVSIDINSPGADALGRGGLEGETDRHFLRRFGGAILLTLLGGAADAVGDDNDTQVIVGVARGGSDAASAALSEEINIPPTISVAQGTPVRIFVARDLDFSNVSGRAP